MLDKESEVVKMARQVNKGISWDERDSNKIYHGTGTLGTVLSISKCDYHGHTSDSCIVHGCTEDAKLHVGFTTGRESDILLRRVQMLR